MPTSASDRPTRPKSAESSTVTLNRVLIARLSALGDVVCTLPAANLIKAAAPDCEIDWVVDPRFAGVAERCGAVDRVIAVKPSLKQEAWAELRRPYDAALDLQGLAKSALAVWKSGAKLKLGYHWQREGSGLVSTPVIPDRTSLHVVDQYLDVARALIEAAGLPVPEEAGFGLAPRSEDADRVQELLGPIGPFAVVNAGAGWVTKRWPPESFGQLVAWLESKGIASVLIGGKAPADQEAAEAVMGHAKSLGANPRSLLGKTSIGELIALISLGRLHIGGDTGSSHIAAALDVPAIGLYSITKPARSCPYRQRDNCLYSPTSLADIACEAVQDKIENVLNEH